MFLVEIIEGDLHPAFALCLWWMLQLDITVCFRLDTWHVQAARWALTTSSHLKSWKSWKLFRLLQTCVHLVTSSLKRPTWRGYAQSCADSGVTFEVGMWCSGVNLSTWAMWATLRDVCLEILDIGIWNCPKTQVCDQPWSAVEVWLQRNVLPVVPPFPKLFSKIWTKQAWKLCMQLSCTTIRFTLIVPLLSLYCF